MTQWPTTRNTLLVRLGDVETDEAWQEFVSIYEPAIYRFARQHGLQHTDAIEVTQQALLRVLKAAEKWLADEPPTKFRAWLKTTVKNLVINLVTRNVRYRGKGGDTIGAEPPAPESPPSTWQNEEHRAILRMAMEQVKQRTPADAWATFSRTILDGQEVTAIAAELGKSVGAVYAARARIVKQLAIESQRILQKAESP